jgi:hypothetical protein
MDRDSLRWKFPHNTSLSQSDSLGALHYNFGVTVKMKQHTDGFAKALCSHSKLSTAI